MANFSEAYQVTMANEGGYANHPSDKGKETYKGIARAFHPNWPGWSTIDSVKSQMLKSGSTLEPFLLSKILASQTMLQAEVRAFYKKAFWDVNRLDEVVNQEIANELFDTGVNCGVGTAARMLQEALNFLNVAGKLYANITVDGAIGPKTLGLVNSHPKPKALLKMLNILQGERYVEIMRKDESQEVFLNSWLSRVAI